MDDLSSTAPSPVSSAFPPHVHTQPGPPLPPPQQQQQQHGHAYQPGFFSGFGSSHGLSPPLPHGSTLHTPASFPSPTGGSVSSGGGVGGGGNGGGGAGGSGGPPLHLLQTAAAVAGYGSSPRHHPPRITQPHFGLSAEDLFASVFGPAGGSGVGLDPEFDFLAPPLTFDWPQFGPPTHAGGAGSNQHHQQTSSAAASTAAGGGGGGGSGGGGGGAGGGDSSSSSSWLDFLSGAADAPRSPRMGKHPRGDGLGNSGSGGGGGGGGSDEGAHGPGGRSG